MVVWLYGCCLFSHVFNHSFHPLGVYKSQVIFNAYPVQTKRHKLVASKAPKGILARTKKTERDFLNEIKMKRMKKEKKKKSDELVSLDRRARQTRIDRPERPDFDHHNTVDDLTDKRRTVMKPKKVDSEIDAKMKLMQEQLGEPVRVRGFTVASTTEAKRSMGKMKREDEILQKKELMELVLGTNVSVTAELKKGTGKLKKEDEILQKKELMELVLGTNVSVQQVCIEDIAKMK
jgi:hypothetical protein